MGGSGHVVTYSYGLHPPAIAYPAYPHQHPHYQTWMHAAPPLKIDYINEIKPADVLCGHGGATNCMDTHLYCCVYWILILQTILTVFLSIVHSAHSGNRYLRAKKRDKPAALPLILWNRFVNQAGTFLIDARRQFKEMCCGWISEMFEHARNLAKPYAKQGAASPSQGRII